MDRRIIATLKHNKYHLLCFNVAKFLIIVPPSLVLHARGQKSSFFDLQRSNSEASTERSPNNLFAPLFEQRVLRCDVGYVITDATYFAIASLHTEEAVDISVSISDKKENNCRLHSLPQRTNPHPTRVRPSNTTWPTSHVSTSLGGGYADEQERLLTFLLLFLFIIIYSTLTPSSFIPRSLDLPGRLMIALLTTKRLC